jgi:preprotein translocase subunit YajC
MSNSHAILVNLAPLLFVFLIFYFLIIKPQQNKMNAQKAMISKLKTGEKILLSSGIIGKIASISDNSDSFKIEIANDIIIEIYGK